MSEATGGEYKQQIEHATKEHCYSTNICVVASQKITLEGGRAVRSRIFSRRHQQQ